MRIGPHQARSGHVSTPAACVLFTARVCSVLGPWDPPVGGPDPIWEGGFRSHSRGPARTSGGPGPTSEVRTVYPGVQDQPWGSGLFIRGPALSHGGPDSLLMLWSMPPSLDTWRLRTRPCGGVGRCCGPRIAA
jgi:hypothetical protein